MYNLNDYSKTYHVSRIEIVLQMQQRGPPIFSTFLCVGRDRHPIRPVSQFMEYRGVQQYRRREQRKHTEQAIQIKYMKIMKQCTWKNI